MNVDFGGRGHAINDNPVDVSSGAEPSPILLDGVQDEAIINLQQTFRQYLTDSILPDGTPLSQAALPISSSTVLADDSENYDDEEEGEVGLKGCTCDGLASRCSVSDGDVCECVQDFGNFYSSDASSDTSMLNLDALPARLPLVECGLDCSCTVECTNRSTQHGVQVPVVIRQSVAGLGAFLSPSSPPLPRGTFIALYAGEYLSSSEARDRWRLYPADNYTLSLRLSSQTIHIDPRYKGNVGRFLNHSCDPNCVVVIVYWGSSWPRAAIFTKRVVEPGEELSFDYGDASGQEDPSGPSTAEVVDSRRRTKCLCGSDVCRGLMPFDETL